MTVVPSRRPADDKEARERPGAGRTPPLASVVALQRLAGNRAVSRLVRSPFDEQPAGVTTGPDALPAGATVAKPEDAKLVSDSALPGGWTDAGGKRTSSGRVGGIDRILLEGITGTQGGKAWAATGGARRGFAAASGTGKAGHRGRAVALVPHSLKRKGGGPVTVVVHLHGIDIGKYSGSSGMRARSGTPEDVAAFQLPQQLEALGNRHAGARVVVLMPLGVTVNAGKGYTVDFGLGDMDTFVDDCLGQLGLGEEGGSVYLSAHSGGGFALSAMMADPSSLPHRYRFGGLFGFESFHGDVGAWSKFVTKRLDADLTQLEGLRAAGGEEKDTTKAQLSYLRDSGFRFAAFGGSGKGYTARVGMLRSAILGWFKDKARRRRLREATGGKAEILNQLWRNYQAVHAEEEHMAALSQDSHFESVLESLPGIGTPGAAPLPVKAPPPPPPKPKAPAKPAAPAGTGTGTGTGAATVPVGEHSDPKRHAEEEHKHEQAPPVRPRVEEAQPQGGAQTERPFKREHYAMSTKDKVLVPKNKAKHLREIAKPPSVYTKEILQLAFPNKDPSEWYDNFTSGVRFLGRPVVHPIHIELAKHLRKVERELTERYGGPGKDPAVAGRVLGLDEGIIGARSYPTSASISMHMFGLAVDVNYTHNPFIGGSANDVFVRAGQLLRPGKAKTKWESGMSWTQLSDLNTLLTDYFALAQDTATLERKLRSASGPWTSMSTQEAQQRIEADLSAKPVKANAKKGIKADRGGLAWRWARGNDIEVVRATGFMNIKRELQEGLKMNWGAAYGDVMHFDLRSDGGVGQAVHTAIGRYFSKLRDEAAKEEEPAPKA